MILGTDVVQQKQKTILCLVGTRPECIKMAPVIKALQQEDWARPVVVSTGQHREMVRDLLGLFEIEIDHDLDVMVADQTLAGLSSRIFASLDPILAKESFDLILVQGDTTSVMIASLAGFYRHIPVGHVEAGLRTHDIGRPFPEELNRVITGLVAQLHFAPTARAAQNLLDEGKDPSTVHITGNTVIDALLSVANGDVFCSFPSRSDRRLILVTAHRRENFGAPIREICGALRDIHDRFADVEIVYPVHPNPNIHGPVHELLGEHARISLIPPADYKTLVALMKHSTLVLTDSGGIQEEAPGLGKPVLVLRDETERPEAIEAGVARLVGSDRKRIFDEAVKLLTDGNAYAAMSRGASPYGDGSSASKIADLCKQYLSL
ncbi:non-hydrolyzing UDP-N-acetylglucosamine 2-epimerase [Phyllobacterium leguminum]|uniref:UDP-N-acetylglucosamine 2-epimerase (non-hydrolyzing) n=1 Tax=Phyllobacterium leguminum TaxID=314237 RepID=A0A318T9B5_9HYPH|nr:UDP-N-acetylglucosamine 2-epimerase (non-hydrolyzing) [Phyllobacterium leguminum]PYE87301.1 UDP-N-acetylglucosamine 2-epimerase [Phyllobacterium leguminum]